MDATESPAAVLDEVTSEIRATLGDDLLGLYLYGSFVSGGFDPGGSDLDLVSVLGPELGERHVVGLGRLHGEFVISHPGWENRLDVIYIGRASLATFRAGTGTFAVISPGEPFHARVDVGDWLQSWYLLRETSLPLVGPPATELVPPIEREEFVDALVDHAELMRTRSQGELAPGGLAYAVLTVCRVLMTVRTRTQPSKPAGAAWVRGRMPESAWLIDAALTCRHSGGRVGFADERTRAAARTFIGQVADEIGGERRRDHERTTTD